MTITAEDIVRREVHYCVSALVSMLAQHVGDAGADLSDAAEQARELCYPIDDWEEAAIQAGWKPDPEFPNSIIVRDGLEKSCSGADRWRAACELDDIEPYQREVFEHWIVSDWLADKLIANGEKVDKDFAGLTVWARTTTGQGIASDSVIEQIVAEINK